MNSSVSTLINRVHRVQQELELELKLEPFHELVLFDLI